MEARNLDSKISIYQYTETTSALLGTTDKTRSLLKTIWANIQPRTGSLLSGREAGTKLSKTTHAITVRSEAVSNIKDDCEIEWTDLNGVIHKFYIDYILPPTRASKFTTIYANEENLHVQSNNI